MSFDRKTEEILYLINKHAIDKTLLLLLCMTSANQLFSVSVRYLFMTLVSPFASIYTASSEDDPV